MTLRDSTCRLTVTGSSASVRDVDRNEGQNDGGSDEEEEHANASDRCDDRDGRFVRCRWGTEMDMKREFDESWDPTWVPV